jgi:hypothetical protein
MEGYAWGSGRDRRTRGEFGWVKRKKRVKKKRFPKKIILEFFYGGDGVYSQEKGLNGVSTSAVSGLENEK